MTGARTPAAEAAVPVGSRRLVAVGVLGLYLLLSVWYTNPLVRLSQLRIAGDAGDPVLNASVLWWNATALPLSEQWWNAPFFYPSLGVTTFTEHLLGVSLVASPIYWLTNNPLAAYNISLFLTWPLSAFAVYLLVVFLTRREDAAILAGLAWAFTPYRLSELGHLQSLSAYWLPVMLLGLHGFLERRRARWLVLFGAGWLCQSLSNGYYMLFGAVLVGMWVAYFCSGRDGWRTMPAILATWVVSSLPLVPIMSTYLAVHDHFALRRSLVDPAGFSAEPRSWVQVSQLSWLWPSLLREDAHSLFPGVTAAFLVVLAVAVWILRGRLVMKDESRAGRVIRAGLAVVTAASLVATLAMLIAGPWRVEIAGLTLRMTDLKRALLLGIVCAGLLAVLTSSTRHALARRSPFVFYLAATLALAVLACGPLIIVRDSVVLDPAPYMWLLSVPGFDRLRVPTRFWMLGTLCLSIAAGLAYAWLATGHRVTRAIGFATVAGCVLLDGWVREFPMAAAPERWPRVERRDNALPILELPLGPEWDAAATYRAIWHRRRTVNGVSGYDPPHYAPLQAGLNAHDPAMLAALASLGPIDVVVDGAFDRDGAWARYVAAAPGGAVVASDGVRTTYRIPAHPPLEPPVGDAFPIVAVDAFRHDPRVIFDGRIETEWGDDPQRPAQWIRADLGEVREVAGITHALGEYARDFPRLLAIDLSVDGASWEEVWKGPTAALAFLAAARAPREAAIRITFPPRSARFVRLRQLAEHKNMWRLAELKVHGTSR
jgi:F5/8 type C domain